jgi:DNA replication initiation complex subunit (GINS family)
MRKLLFLFVIIGFIVASCSSPKSDAEKICNCREKVMKKAIEIKGNRSYSDLTKEENDKIEVLVKECNDKEDKFKEKYKDAKATEFKTALDACFEKIQKEYGDKLE